MRWNAIVLAALCVAGGCAKSRERPAANVDAAPPKPQGPPPRKGRPAPPLPDPLPGARTGASALVGDAVRGAAGDLDGDGKAELVLVGGETLRVVRPDGTKLAELAAPGGVQVLEVVDLDGDRRAEILAGWGATPERRDAMARVTLHRLVDGKLTDELLLWPKTTRNQIVSILVEGSNLLVAWFESKYIVRASRLTRGESGWRAADLTDLRMATSWARGDVTGDGKPDFVIGRAYGDDIDLDGDAFLFSDGTRVPIATTRGVRSLTLADADADGALEVVLSDGWHKDYARQARGLVTWARWDGAAFRTELIEDTEGQSMIERMIAADVDGRQGAEIVTVGQHYVRVFRFDGARWTGLTIAGPSRDVIPLELDGKPGVELIVLAERAEIVSLAGSF